MTIHPDQRRVDVHPPLPREGRRGTPEFTALVQDHIAGSFYLDVGRCCDQDCAWCSTPSSDDSWEPREVLEARCSDATRLGWGPALFIGGEPSLYPDLEALMRHGRDQGVRSFGIMTNGSGLQDPARVRVLADLGMRYWQLSWDTSREETLLRALENISAAGAGDVIIYQVLHRGSLADLSSMVERVADLRTLHPMIRMLMAALVKPVGRAAEDPGQLPDFAAVPAVLADALTRSRGLDLPLWLPHLTGCLLPGHPEQHAALPWERVRVLEPRSGDTTPLEDDLLTKGAACRRCVLFEDCTGYYPAWGGGDPEAIFRPTGALLRDVPLVAEEEATSGAPSLIDRLRDRIAPALPAGWSLTNAEWIRPGTPRVLGLDIAGPDDAELAIRIASLESGEKGYIEAGGCVLWHGGEHLAPEGIAVLDGLRPLLEVEGATLAELLDAPDP